MSEVKRRLTRLEERLKPKDKDYPCHIYEHKDETGDHTRENCEMCAAMSDEEYAAYRDWCDRQPKTKVLCIEVRTYDERKAL